MGEKGMDCEERYKTVCEPKFKQLEQRLDVKSESLDEVSNNVTRLIERVDNLVKALDAQVAKTNGMTRAIWGLVTTLLITFITMFLSKF
jgi:nitrate/nitrite-specific signal transduction histidine kinase